MSDWLLTEPFIATKAESMWRCEPCGTGIREGEMVRRECGKLIHDGHQWKPWPTQTKEDNMSADTTGPALAGTITISQHTLQIDGEDFPWYTTEDGPTTHCTGGDYYEVTITLFAERVIYKTAAVDAE